MKTSELKTISESLIETFEEAGKVTIDLYKKGLKIEVKEDKSPVSNGDLKVNELITNKIKDITPNLPIVSEETVDLNVKNTGLVQNIIRKLKKSGIFIQKYKKINFNSNKFFSLIIITKKTKDPYLRRIVKSFKNKKIYKCVKFIRIQKV